MPILGGSVGKMGCCLGDSEVLSIRLPREDCLHCTKMERLASNSMGLIIAEARPLHHESKYKYIGCEFSILIRQNAQFKQLVKIPSCQSRSTGVSLTKSDGFSHKRYIFIFSAQHLLLSSSSISNLHIILVTINFISA
jgi:hypothetical protein